MQSGYGIGTNQSRETPLSYCDRRKDDFAPDQRHKHRRGQKSRNRARRETYFGGDLVRIQAQLHRQHPPAYPILLPDFEWRKSSAGFRIQSGSFISQKHGTYRGTPSRNFKPSFTSASTPGSYDVSTF